MWSAIIKSGDDKYLSTLLVSAGAGLIGALVLPFIGMPARPSWPYIGVSACAEVAYYVFIARAYTHGDMSRVYPLMRGVAPLLVALASGSLLGEALPPLRWIAVAAICGGVLALMFADQQRTSATGSHAVISALISAALIAGCTLIDAVGVRRSGAPAAYTLSIFTLTAMPLVAWTAARRLSQMRAYLRGKIHLALIGGGGVLASYGLALWAITFAPVAMVAALRESSIVFATLISAVVLKEKVSARRLGAIAAIIAGIVLMRVS